MAVRELNLRNDLLCLRREEIASGFEKAYASLPQSEVARLLFLQDANEVNAIVEQVCL